MKRSLKTLQMLVIVVVVQRPLRDAVHLINTSLVTGVRTIDRTNEPRRASTVDMESPTPSSSSASTMRASMNDWNTDEEFFEAFERTFAFRAEDDYDVGVASTSGTTSREFDMDDVLYFVDTASGSGDREVFVRRWTRDACISPTAAEYARVDWRETLRLNVCAQSVYEVVVKQFDEKDRSDLKETARVRAYASPFYVALDDEGKATETLDAYPLICFSLDDALELDAKRGGMAYVTLRRVHAASATDASGRGDEDEYSSVVFSTHAALRAAPTKLGCELLRSSSLRSPSRRDSLSSPIKFFTATPMRFIQKLITGKSSPSPARGGSAACRPGVELYGAGDARVAFRSLLAPCVDVVYDIALHRRNGIPFGSMFAPSA